MPEENNEEKNKIDDLPSLAEFCLTLPLYAERRLQHASEELYQFISDKSHLDCFCLDCQRSSTFLSVPVKMPVEVWEFKIDSRIFSREFFCTRVFEHKAYFHFQTKKIENETITGKSQYLIAKIGQSPSMADLAESEILQYRKVLGKADFNELSKAIGLASHGIGIGSFVYLRRIFERLVEQAHEVAKKADNWSEEEYNRSRMAERILQLKDQLPPFLVDQRSTYGILSQGVHALDEETCLKHFPIVRAGIELMLEQKEAARKTKIKEMVIAKELQEIRKNH